MRSFRSSSPDPKSARSKICTKDSSRSHLNRPPTLWQPVLRSRHDFGGVTSRIATIRGSLGGEVAAYSPPVVNPVALHKSGNGKHDPHRFKIKKAWPRLSVCPAPLYPGHSRPHRSVSIPLQCTIARLNDYLPLPMTKARSARGCAWWSSQSLLGLNRVWSVSQLYEAIDLNLRSRNRQDFCGERSRF